MWYGHNLPYSQVEPEYIRRARYAVGEAKADEVKAKIASSSTVNKFLQQTIQLRRIPNQKEIVTSVQSIFYFLFKSHATVALASLYVLERWNKEVNAKHYLADDETLVDTIERLMAFCENVSNGTAKW